MYLKNTTVTVQDVIEKLLLFQLCVISISIAAASIALAATIVLYLIELWRKKNYASLHTPLTYFIAAYIAVEYIATVWSLSPYDSLHNSKRLLLLFLIPITIFSFNTKEKIQRMLILSSSVVAFTSLGEIIFYFYEHTQRLYVFQHYMTTGGLKMIFCLFLMPFILDRELKTKEKAFYSAAFILIFIALILTNTRSAWLGLIFGSIIMGILYYKKLFAYFIVIVSLFFLFAPQQQTNRAKSIVDPNDPTNKGRLMMWSTGLKIWKDYPLFGVGDIDLYDIYQNYKSPEDHEPAGHLHNNFITLLVTIGSVGLISVCALMYKIIRMEYLIFKKWKQFPFIRNISLGTLSIVCGFLMNGIFEWNFGDHEIMVFVWFTVGLCIAVKNVSETGSV